MADSIRQQIVDAVDARLRTILVTNGFETDAGASTFQWRVVPVEADETPALVYKDTVDNIELTVGEDVHSMRLEVECYSYGDTATSELRKILADINQAVRVDPTFGQLAQDTNIRDENIDVRQEDRRIASVNVGLEIQYTTEHHNAYQ